MEWYNLTYLQQCFTDVAPELGFLFKIKYCMRYASQE